MKNNIEFKVKEFLDNVVMMRMDDDLEVLGKRLGFAEKKKEEMRGTKKWWKLIEITKDPRHGTDPLTKRGQQKKEIYLSFEKEMKKNGEEFFYEDSEDFKKKAKALFKGEHSLILSLLVLTYIKYSQNVYMNDLPIEKKGETFEKVIEPVLGNVKDGDSYYSTIHMSYGKIINLPKIAGEDLKSAIKLVLSILRDKVGVEGIDEYINALGLNDIDDSMNTSKYERTGVQLALMDSLIKSTKSSSYNQVYRRAFIEFYLNIRKNNAEDTLLEQKDLANNKKVLKMFHRFEEDIVGQ